MTQPTIDFADRWALSKINSIRQLEFSFSALPFVWPNIKIVFWSILRVDKIYSDAYKDVWVTIPWLMDAMVIANEDFLASVHMSYPQDYIKINLSMIVPDFYLWKYLICPKSKLLQWSLMAILGYNLYCIHGRATLMNDFSRKENVFRGPRKNVTSAEGVCTILNTIPVPGLQENNSNSVNFMLAFR